MSDWSDYRREAARAAMLEVDVGYAAAESVRAAAQLRAWVTWSTERGALHADYAADVLRIADEMERRARRLGQHREHFEKIMARYEVGAEPAKEEER